MRGFNDSLEYINLGESSSLDIRTEYKYKGKSALSNIRATVNGLSNIKQYCLSDSLEGLNTEFLKKNTYKDPSSKSKKFGSLQNIEYNFRINLKNELNLSGETNEQVLHFKNRGQEKTKCSDTRKDIHL